MPVDLEYMHQTSMLVYKVENMGNEHKYQSSSISHIQNPWKKLEVLIWQCLNQDEIIRKIGGEEADNVDFQNSFRNFLRFDERTYEADPEERIRFFFNNMWGYNALSYLGIPEREYGGYTNEQVINRITRELGFKDISVQPPKGITYFLNKAWTSISRAEEHPKDKDQVNGACVNIFRSLEKIFKETLYVYAYWRFKCELQYTGLSIEQKRDIPVLRRVDSISVSENKFETHTQEHQAIDDIQNQDDFEDEFTGKFFTKWIVQNRLKEKIKNDRVTLGDYRTIFYDIDKLIHEEDVERNRFFNGFRRSFLLMPISTNNYIDIPLPDTLNYTELRNSIKGRNVIIH